LEISAGRRYYGDPPADCATFLVNYSPPLPDGSVVVWTVTTVDETPVAAAAPCFAREDSGGFCIVGAARGASVCAAVPFAGLRIDQEEDLLLHGIFLAPHPQGLVVVDRFATPFHARPREWPAMDHFSGLLALCMGMALADGELSREEVKTIRTFFSEAFSLDAHQAELRRAMKRNPAAERSIGELLEDVFARFPSVFCDSTSILRLLASMAHADGRIDAGEVEYLRSVHQALGADPRYFAEMLEFLQMDTADPYSVLGLQKGAGLEEAKSAYRRLMADYHPDKYADRPAEFQDLARDRSALINNAYEELKVLLNVRISKK